MTMKRNDFPRSEKYVHLPALSVRRLRRLADERDTGDDVGPEPG